jgi:hypothetical protein
MPRSVVRLIIKTSCLFLIGFCLISCSSQSVAPQKTNHAQSVAGIWDLKARIADDAETPVTQRFMRLSLNPDGTFRAEYRGDESQKWVRAGQGGFSYNPPLLSMHWESGATSTLLVRDFAPDRMVLHHGRNMTPLADQDPDEVFVREKPEKGPTR